MNPTQVCLRPALEDDAAGLAELISGLSATSKYFRFLGGLGRPSAQLLARMLRRDDTHGAWLAVIDETPVGHVMWSLVDGAVELGAVVTDAWQQRGIGRWLIQTALAEAAVAGAVAMQVDVHVENRRATAMIRRAMPAALVTREAELLTFRAPITVDAFHSSDYRQRNGCGPRHGLAGAQLQPDRHAAGGSTQRPIPGPGPLARRGAVAVGDRH